MHQRQWKISGKNGLDADASENFLSAMRRIAHAESHTDYTTAVLAFRTSNLYVTNKRVKTYTENWWLNLPEVRAK